MAHSISIIGTIPLTGDIVADSKTVVSFSDAMEAFKVAIAGAGGTITMERGYTGPADAAKKERKPRAKKTAPDAA